MSLTKQDILAMNDSALKKLCSEKKIKGINKRSSRNECIDALLKHAQAPPSSTKVPKSPIVNRRRKLPNSSRRLLSHSASPVRPVLSSSRKKRKRPFREMQSSGRSGSDGHTSDSDSQRRKRRRTLNTPNQNTPMKNPREPLVAPGKQYISNDFDALLNASDSDDDDVAITDKEIPSPPIPPSKRPPPQMNGAKKKDKIITIKPSSDDEDDEELTESESKSSENEEFSESDDTPRARRRRDRERKKSREKQRQQRDRRRRRSHSRGRKRNRSRHRSGDEITSSEEETATDSAFSDGSDSMNESNSLSEQRRHRLLSKQKSRSKSKSRLQGSRSHSTATKRNRSDSNLNAVHSKLRSSSRPRNTSKSMSNSMQNLSVLSPQNTMKYPMKSPSSPYSVPKYDSTHSLAGRPIPRPGEVPTTPMSTSRSMTPPSTWRQCINTIGDVVEAVLHIPRQIFRGIRFLFKHWMTVLIVGVLSILLYSPTKKVVSNFDYQHAAVSVLQKIRIIPTVKYCNSVDGEYAHHDGKCEACPKDADCHDGIAYCKGDRVLIRGECIYDENEVKRLTSEMRYYTQDLLSSIRAEDECRSYWLYTLFDEPIEGEFDGMYLSEEALRKQLADALQLDIRSHLFTQVFGKFTSEIKSRDAGSSGDISIKRKDLDFVVDKGYFSHKTDYSMWCSLSMLLTDNALVIVPCIMVTTLVLMVVSVRRSRKLRKQRAKQRVKDGKRDVLRMLREHMNNSHQRWIPIVAIKAQLNGGEKNKTKEKEWRRIVKDVDRDANVTRSVQMVDGVQKDCWKLSDIALSDW